MGAGSGDVLFLTADWEHDVGAGAVKLITLQLAFEDGGAGISKISMSATITRTEITTLRTAAAQGPSAFDTAMAASSQATWYASVVAAATNANLSGQRRPENLIRRAFLGPCGDYAS